VAFGPIKTSPTRSLKTVLTLFTPMLLKFGNFVMRKGFVNLYVLSSCLLSLRKYLLGQELKTTMHDLVKDLAESHIGLPPR